MAGPAEAGRADQHYVMISAVTGGPYWIDSKAGLYDKAKELGVTAVFTGPPTVDVNAADRRRQPGHRPEGGRDHHGAPWPTP